MGVTSASRHTLRQLKFVLPGGAITWYFDTYNQFSSVLGLVGWARSAALSSMLLGLLTIALFLSILLIPWIKGTQPNYRSWRESGILSRVIPILTASIVSGWSILVFTLARWSSLGFPEGIVAASGLYALVFGLMGLIPAPAVRRD